MDEVGLLNFLHPEYRSVNTGIRTVETRQNVWYDSEKQNLSMFIIHAKGASNIFGRRNFGMVILRTPRLYVRKIKTDDYSSICSILQDIDVMYAWEHAFSDEEVVQWIDENVMRYNRDGYSYWAVIEKASDKLIGVTGLISEQADDENYVGVGYIYEKSYWGNGYAFEAASACVDYAFNILNLNEITAQIRPENTASRKVAERLGMSIKKQFIRRYKNKDIPHLLYSRII